MCKEEFEVIKGELCFPACINNILNYQNCKISEEDLFMNENFLMITECENGLSIDVYSLVKAVGNTHNLDILSFSKMLNIKKIDNLINEYGTVVFNVNIKYLFYNNFFQRASKLANNYHCINVHKIKGKYMYISDAYIPATPISAYKGWVELDEKAYEKANINVCIADNFIEFSKEEIKDCIERAIVKAKAVNAAMFYKYKKNIIELEKCEQESRREKLFSMATEIGTGGVLTARIYLKKQLEKYEFVSNSLIKKLEDIINQYINLKIVLLKNSFYFKTREIYKITNIIDFISNQEEIVFNEIYLECKGMK